MFFKFREDHFIPHFLQQHPKSKRGRDLFAHISTTTKQGRTKKEYQNSIEYESTQLEVLTPLTASSSEVYFLQTF